MLLVGLFVGVVALYLGAEWLVRGASRIAAAMDVSALVIGLTVVAFGTSMPEMVAGGVAAWNGSTEIVLGNVLGSNAANIGLILGLSALVRTIPVQRALFRREIPFMLLATVVVYTLGAQGGVSRVFGVLLFLSLVGFTVMALNWSRQEKAPTAVDAARLEQDLGLSGEIRVGREVGRVALGLVALTVGADLLVDAAVSLAREFGISEFLISVTMVAVGTSLPELATSIVAAIRDEADVLVGNIVGSNIFNLLGALGVAAVIQPIPVRPEVVAFDFPVVLAFSLAMTIGLFSGGRLNRWEGGLLLAGYVTYIGVMVL